MNNLLRTLTESQFKSAFPDSNLKLLLTTVKDGRRQSYDNKLADPFYDSLEGLLVDLRTITIDNHDAEAFLRPVQKSEVPDYYDVIANPMDLQTMLKKVKQKQYKSKREFKDDLDLIWSNCYTYNATENHPLRLCAKRLKAKSERLLKNITDRKERTDPPIPSDLPSTPTNQARPKLNGHALVNGHSQHRSPSLPTVSKAGTPTIKPSTPLKKPPRKDLPFPDTPAIIRTPTGMTTFFNLDRGMDGKVSSKLVYGLGRNSTPTLVEQLREYAPFGCESDSEDIHTPDDSSMVVDEVLGDKRKINGIVDHRPRKRARFSSQFPTPPPSETEDVTNLWWHAVASDTLIGNGLPGIAFPSSLSLSSPGRTPPKLKPKPTLKRKRRKKSDTAATATPPKSMLTIMNNNIRTMKRVRRTHAKFAALNLSSSNNEDADGAGLEMPGFGGGTAAAAMAAAAGVGLGGDEEDGLGVDDDRVDDRPWKLKGNGKGRVRGGVEIGEENATDCVRWMGGKVLEHAGFQGTSKEALDVLAGVTSEYLLNVGRTIRFLCDKYSNTMTPEEIMLHTLFESGTSKIQDLERYISDDVERYGARLGDLEKKLVGAYREATAVEVLDDEGLFDEEDEEDGGALVMGNFADAFGEDFLGLRELGIAAEYGMSSLTIPKRLLKGKKGESKFSAAAAKPTEPPPPFPPPPPFIPLNSAKVEDQIGLLKPYYQNRLLALSTATPLSAMPLAPPPFGFPPSAPMYGSLGASQSMDSIGEVQPPVVVLPDDPPNPGQVKMGPIGQIIKGGPSSGASKKKAKAAAAAAAAGAGGVLGLKGEGGDVVLTEVPTPKKKKGATGVGTGNGRKKKLADALALAQAQGQDQGQGQGSPLPPPVVAASA